MSTPLPTRLVQAAESAIHEVVHENNRGCPAPGDLIDDARAATVAVLRRLFLEVGPVGQLTVENLWSQLVVLADEIEGAPR